MKTPVSRVCEVQVRGPLAPYATEFTAGLATRGYTPLTTVNELRLMGHLSRWMLANKVLPSRFTRSDAEVFLAAQRSGGYGAQATLAVLAPLLQILRGLGVMPTETPSPSAEMTASETLLSAFRVYLLMERGLAETTVAAYVVRASRFLERCAPAGRLDALEAADVSRSVIAESQALSVGSVQFFVVAVRAFLRFAFRQALTPTDLSAAVLGSTGRAQTFLPKGLDQMSVTALLDACDRSDPIGRRDFAVLVTLLRLGLRAGEVARLSLRDINWRTGEIVVHGKGRRIDRLPLPADVGAAISGYLQNGRPAGSHPEVFLRSLAPVGGLGRGGISFIVRRASQRAGIPPIGAHRLRHTAACQMVTAGVPLAEIGQALRHRSSISTAGYARLDVEALRGLAQDWPASGAGERA